MSEITFPDLLDVKTAVKPAIVKLQPPKKYQVVLLNDDYTPMEFVVVLLMELFFLGEDDATKIMLDIHHQGRGICGIYTQEIAETKVKQVIDYARSKGHPLMCCMEPV